MLPGISILSVIAITARFQFVESFLVSMNPNDIRFLLYKDTKNRDISIEIPLNEGAFNSSYNASLPLILLIHDVLSNPNTHNDVQLIKNAYLEENYESNIMIVDYGRLTSTNFSHHLLQPHPTRSFIRLLASFFNVNRVAKRIVEFIGIGLKTKAIGGPEYVHLVGYGMGAHIAGVVGRRIQQAILKPIRRITGLDPWIHYEVLPTSGLDESDAHFVDVTFTSLFIAFTLRRMGHAQFYLNGGGAHQPNCPNFFPFTERYCSHTTAVYYFAKSIKNKSIPACKCRGLRCRLPHFFPPRQCKDSDLTVYGHCVPEMTRGNFLVTLS